MVNDPRFSKKTASIREAAKRAKQKGRNLKEGKTPEARRFDVFISHSSVDKAAVRELVRKLESKQISVWLDEDQLVAGQPWQEAMDEALRSVNSVLIFIGASGIGPWAQSEVAYGITKQAEDPNFRVIPVLGPGASIETIPPLLRNLSFIDLRELDETEFVRLEHTLKEKRSARTKGASYKPKVFLCHAKEDADRVEALYYKLQDQGLDPWYDKKNLVIGDEWEEEILRAIERTDLTFRTLVETFPVVARLCQ